ncbi:hypothetical protein JX265_008025 [Neoarthrinium moseri]|uniref:Uncharacterized protein n=1 Tax=Neoarthrinium moseri TaxID=1658444 RepID=A0A9P9WIZ9_9PEZI|nr:hypothetical protein JX265_008025 [Neoarthrinium moseri]
MLGKSHCRFDIADPTSEFADFYDFSDVDTDSEEESEGDTCGKTAISAHETSIRLDEESMRLPSGKVVSKSSHMKHQQRLHRHRPSTPEEDNQRRLHVVQEGTDKLDQGNETASAVSVRGRHDLTNGEKRDSAFTTQLAQLSANDRRSLMHLPSSQQRSILATQKKQLEKARRAERRYQGRVEGLGNKTLMAHFKPDTPGRSNG